MNDISEVRFNIAPFNESYDQNDHRWLEQVNDLVCDLQHDVGNVHTEVHSVKGMKGLEVEALILALGSAGAITAAVDMFRAWISRDQSRELEISVEREGETQTFRVSGNRMDKDDIRKFMESAFEG